MWYMGASLKQPDSPQLSMRAKETLKPKKLWRTLRVRYSFLGFGFIYACLLSLNDSSSSEI